MLKCSNCGKRIVNTAEHCYYCGREVSVSKICPKCGTSVSAASVFCKICGFFFGHSAPEKPQKDHCPKCGSEFTSGGYFCPVCGEKTEENGSDKDTIQELCISSLLRNNPVASKTESERIRYYLQLKRSLDEFMNCHTISQAQKKFALERLELYRQKLCPDYIEEQSEPCVNMDLISLLGYSDEAFRYCSDKFTVSAETYKLRNDFGLNAEFAGKKPFTALIAATMSAGKSTFINALTGKSICRTENQACTGQIHKIIGKPYEDGIVSRYGGELTLCAGDELLLSSDTDGGDEIAIGTYFNGFLGGKRVILSDSPGVNSALHHEHGALTRNIIKDMRYSMIIFLINLTNYGTDDEKAFLDYIRENLNGRKVLFVLNKVSCVNDEEESLNSIISNIRKYLSGVGFSDPLICPVDSKAAFLAKRMLLGDEFNRSVTREYDFYESFFSQNSLSEYYAEYFPDYRVYGCSNQYSKLLCDCGASFIEKIIASMAE